MGRVCKIPVEENHRGRVAHCWERPQLVEVASELVNDLELITGGCQCCQKFAWIPQRFSVDELGHGRLQIFLKSRTHAEENEAKVIGPKFLRPAHNGGIE